MSNRYIMKCEHNCTLQDQLNRLQARLDQALARNEQLEIENAVKTEQIAWYEEQVAIAKQRRFGHSKDSDNAQLQLFHFNEAEKLADPKAPEPLLEAPPKPRPPITKDRKGRLRKLADHLPRHTTVYTLTKEERICDACGGERRYMDKEIRLELEVTPAKFEVHAIEREVFVCDACAKTGDAPPIVTAEAPKPPIERSMASPSLLAYIATLKYCDGMPLYRIEQMLRRYDIDISRQNLANWMINSEELWLSMLYKELHQQLLKRDILHSDETHLQVLRESGRSPQTKSSMWLYCTGRHEADRSIVLFDYRQTKAGEWPKLFLQGFSGYLQVDGAPVYHGLPDTILIGCWSHARRGFTDVLKVMPKGIPTWDTHAGRGLEFCDMLFDLEREYDNLHLSPEERHLERQIYSRVVLDAFYDWLIREKPNILPKSLLGKAVDYCLRQWQKLCNFMLDGRLVIHNNKAEQHIKPFVIGRKNFLFSVTPKGAKASAMIYSLVETAKANGLNPFEYLKWLFEVMPNMRLSPENMQTLLPWSSDIPDVCKMNLQ